MIANRCCKMERGEFGMWRRGWQSVSDQEIGVRQEKTAITPYRDRNNSTKILDTTPDGGAPGSSRKRPRHGKSKILDFTVRGT